MSIFCNVMVLSFLKIPQIEVQGSFFIEKLYFCYVMFYDCPYFLSKTLDKVYSNQLKSCNSTNR